MREVLRRVNGLINDWVDSWYGALVFVAIGVAVLVLVDHENLWWWLGNGSLFFGVGRFLHWLIYVRPKQRPTGSDQRPVGRAVQAPGGESDSTDEPGESTDR